MRQYFRETMEIREPEPDHTIAWSCGLVSLQQRGPDDFAVRYGKQVKAGLRYSTACHELGACLMHQLACNGEIDGSCELPGPEDG